jgi:Transposase IS116/IS110/IS902 family
MAHPGVGPLTALAFELVIGTQERFHCGKQVASYVGLVPSEESSGERRRLGHISKQGNGGNFQVRCVCVAVEDQHWDVEGSGIGADYTAMLYELGPHQCAIRISWSLDPTIQMATLRLGMRSSPRAFGVSSVS